MKTIKNNKQILTAGRVLYVGLCLWMLLASCTSREDAETSGNGVALRFSLPGIGENTRAAGESDLPEGTTVRILAYRHTDSGALPAENYASQNTYVIQNGVPVPCTVSEEGTVVTIGGVNMSLTSGEYDFYAVTPALPVTRGAENPTVQVGHGTDLAVSLTTSTVSDTGASSTQNITLNALKRQCALISMEADLASDVPQGITNIRIRELTLDNMTETPLTLTKEAFAAGANNYSLVLGEQLFKTDPEDARKASGSSIVLPKQAATFGVSMKLQFNGATSITVATKTGMLPAIAFESGKRYTLSAKLTQAGTLGLWLTVSYWTGSELELGFGGTPGGIISNQLLGEWTQVTWENGFGGIPTGNIITGVTGWWTNVDYNPDFGE